MEQVNVENRVLGVPVHVGSNVLVVVTYYSSPDASGT